MKSHPAKKLLLMACMALASVVPMVAHAQTTTPWLSLPTASTVSGADILPVVIDPSGTTVAKKLTINVLLDYADSATLTLTNKTLSGSDNNFSNIAQSSIVNLVTDLGNKQPLDADLTALAALTTTSYGRGLNELADAAALRTYGGLGIGTDVLAYDAQVQQISALTDPNADRLLFWDDSDNAYKHLELGANLSITGTTLDASGGGGGGQLAEWAYVDPANGDDTTGDGTAGNPWETLQKAAGTEGRDYIVLAAGNAGPLTISTTRSISIQGAGRANSIIGAITVTNGASLNFQDIGMHSFQRGDINLFGGSEGQDGGDLVVRGSAGGGNFTSFGFNSTTTGLAGSSGGAVVIYHSEFEAASSNGGNGGDGDGCTTSGQGGSAGNVTVYYSMSTSAVSSNAGAAGGDGGAGQGSAGTGGNIISRFSDLQAVGDNGSNDVHASMIGGSWVD